MIVLALSLAALAAVALAVGTHLQHRGVRAAGTGSARVLLRRPVWLLGTGLLGAATVLNIVALGLAPVALVQPVGSLSLVLAVVISAVALKVRVTPGLVCGVALTVVSVVTFVAVASAHVRESAATPLAMDGLIALSCSLGLLALLIALRPGAGHLPRVLCAGLLYGCVAASAHVSVGAVFSGATLGPRWWILVTVMLGASAAGLWLVQTAYASGPPETVLAGLTVIDPLTAVGLATLLLHEDTAASAGVVALLVAAAAAALAGIALLARHHPDVRRRAAAARPRTAASGASPLPLLHVEG